MRRRFCNMYIILILSTLFLLLGCSSSSPPLSSIALSFTSKSDLNPDINSRPSPVDICIFQLRNSEHFIQSKFFDLYTHTTAALDKSLIEEYNIEIKTNQTRKLNITLDKETQYLGFLVAYYDLEHAKWRDIKAISTLTGNITITLNARDFLIETPSS